MARGCFGPLIFESGEQRHKKGRFPTLLNGDKKATTQPPRSSLSTALSAGASAGVRLRAPASASFVPQGPASRTCSAIAWKPALSYRAVLVGTREKEKVHVDQVQERLGMYLEHIEMLRVELARTESDDSPVEAGLTTTDA